MTHPLVSTNNPRIERLPAGGVAGFCCDDRNCAPCLRAYREGLALFGETSGKSVPVASHTPRQSSPDGLKTAAQAAAKLNCSIKTLNGHVASGALRYVIIGHGTKRPRRMFTDADLDAFIASQTRKDAPCRSTASRARHTGTSIFSGAVIAFTAQPKPRTSVKPKK
jgi:hypothetical protein